MIALYDETSSDIFRLRTHAGKMPPSDFRAKIEQLKRPGAFPKLLLLGGVAIGVGYFLSGMVTVSPLSNPAAWAYQSAIVLILIGLAVWAAAKIIGYPPPSSE